MLDLEEIERSVSQHGWGSVGNHAKALVAEVKRQKSLLKLAMAIITEAIMHGMPITEEVAALRNEIVCGKHSNLQPPENTEG
jgi:hypothetical protein